MKIASVPAPIALRILSAFGFGFFLSMFTRAVANIIKQPVQLDLGLSEETLSLAMGTSFFVAFGLMQLPLGVLLDRYDPRKVNASLLVVAGVGGVLFATAQSAGELAFGRALMGIGFAGGMMASLKTYSLWFPVDKLPTITGLQFAIGITGAISATKPTEWLLRAFDWREIYLVFAGLTFLAALIMALWPPKHQDDGHHETFAQLFAGMGRVFRDSYFWRITPWAFISLGISQGIGTLYVFSWMTDVAAYNVSDAASLLTLTASVSIINFLLMGRLAEWLRGRGFGLMTLPSIGMTLSMLALMALVLQWTDHAIAIWLVWTISISTGVITMSAIAKAFPVSLSGRAYTAFNLMGFGMTAIAQWMVGYVLDLYPRVGGAASPEGYQIGFAILLGFQLLGMIWFIVASFLGIGMQTMIDAQEGIEAPQGFEAPQGRQTEG